MNNNYKDEIVVSVRDLERRFGSFIAVNKVSFDVYKGEIFGFLGPNGAGKSTTIRMLCGILNPTGGSGTISGFDIRKESEQIKLKIGYMSQKFSLYEDLTVEENIDFFNGIYNIPKERKSERKEWVIEMAGLQDHRKAFPRDLSGGWKQRLALGCAILHDPPIIFLDEPTSGVDPISRRMFWDLIYELTDKGITVFVTTHYMDEAEYCDRIGLIYRGELISLGTPDELKRTHMKETVLEITCSKPQDKILEVEEIPEVKEAAIFGHGLHVILMDSIEETMQNAMQKIEPIFDEDDKFSQKKIISSLENVFVSLIEAKDRERTPVKEVRR